MRRLRSRPAMMLALVSVGCAGAAHRVPGPERDFWAEQGCFAHILPQARRLEASKLEGVVFTAGYRPAEFPVPVAVVYARRWPDGKISSADVDQDGRFVIPAAAEGLYELGVCANGWNPWRGSVQIRRDAPVATLALPLELGM